MRITRIQFLTFPVLTNFINYENCRGNALIYCLNPKIDTRGIKVIFGSTRTMINIIDAVQSFPLQIGYVL